MVHLPTVHVDLARFLARRGMARESTNITDITYRRHTDVCCENNLHRLLTRLNTGAVSAVVSVGARARCSLTASEGNSGSGEGIDKTTWNEMRTPDFQSLKILARFLNFASGFLTSVSRSFRCFLEKSALDPTLSLGVPTWLTSTEQEVQNHLPSTFHLAPKTHSLENSTPTCQERCASSPGSSAPRKRHRR